MTAMDNEQFFLPRSVMSLPAFEVIPHLLDREDFVVDGFHFTQAFEAGLGAIPDMDLSGYIWPFVFKGHSIDEPTALWFAVPGYRASSRWISQFMDRKREYHDSVAKYLDVLWDREERHMGKGVIALERQIPDTEINRRIRAWNKDNARQFLLLGRKDPDTATVIISDLPIPDPMVWRRLGEGENLSKPFLGA